MQEKTTTAAGSPRALKRRRNDAEMTPDEAEVKRAKQADRTANSQKLTKLKHSDRYMFATPEEQAEMESKAIGALEKHRRESGQDAMSKVLEALYDSMDDFISRDGSSDSRTNLRKASVKKPRKAEVRRRWPMLQSRGLRGPDAVWRAAQGRDGLQFAV